MQNKSDIRIAQSKYKELNAGSCAQKEKEWHDSHLAEGQAANRKWKQNNKQSVNTMTAARRSAKLQRTPKWLTQTHLQQIGIFYDAASKLTKEFGIKMEVDHVVPLQGKNVSGLHVPWNLQVLPKSINCSKGNSHE